MVRSFCTAWHFLTALPVSAAYHDPTPSDLARSMRWFPTVGLVLGGCLAATDWLLTTLLPATIVTVLVIVMLVLLTRGLHVDGLADAVDGIAGGRTPMDRLAIMRDPRIGAVGATGLMLALGLRYAGLLALPAADRLAVLICMPAVGRWAMVMAAYAMPYARADGGLAQPFLSQLAAADLVRASVPLTVALLWVLGPVAAVAGLLTVVLVARLMAMAASRLLNGITGDVLGAVNEVTEIVFVLVAPTLWQLKVLVS